MTIVPDTTRVPIVPVLLAGAGAQLADDLAYLLVPPLALLAPLSGLLAVLLTVGAARLVTRRRHGAAIARTGLAVGVASAAVGLVIGGFGVLALLLAGLTVLAGVSGAVVGRVAAPRLP